MKLLTEDKKRVSITKVKARFHKFPTQGGVMPENIISLRKSLGLSQEKFARLLNVSISTIVRAEKSNRIPLHCQKTVINLGGVVTRLMGTGEPEDILYWLTKPNPDLRGYRPIDLVYSDYGTSELLNHINSWS